MTTYSPLERSLARLFEATPRVRKTLRATYQRAQYYLRGGHPSQVVLNPLIGLCNSKAQGRRTGECQEFFGYFDRQPWDETFETQLVHRVYPSQPSIEILARKIDGREVTIASSMAWNYQQACLTQWRPAHPGELIFNDILVDRLVSRVVDVVTGSETTMPWPFQVLHPDGNSGLTLNYRRLARLRPEYGYSHPVGNFSPDDPLTEDGVWQIDFLTGTSKLMVSLAELIIQEPRPSMKGAAHKINHIMYSPVGKHAVFMHRWFSRGGRASRLWCLDLTSGDLKLLMDDGVVSHYSWLDDSRLVVWGRGPSGRDGYHLLDIRDTSCSLFSNLGDGHPSPAPGGTPFDGWIVSDTYPDKRRMRTLYLLHLESARRVDLGRFFAPWAYDGPTRCDLHPRWRPDGTVLSIDSAHTGVRRTYRVDLSKLLTSLPTDKHGRARPI